MFTRTLPESSININLNACLSRFDISVSCSPLGHSSLVRYSRAPLPLILSLSSGRARRLCLFFLCLLLLLLPLLVVDEDWVEIDCDSGGGLELDCDCGGWPELDGLAGVDPYMDVDKLFELGIVSASVCSATRGLAVSSALIAAGLAEDIR